jgi:pyruvate formate lyase activating enzyme
MKIKGLQKTSLIDYPGCVSCVIFLYGCNFRCGFCYNPGLVLREDSPDISEKEILKFLDKRKGILDAVCISGGEPLMSLDIGFVEKIKAMGYKIKIDTNGSFPDKLREMIKAGLIDYVAMDLKATKEKYSLVAGTRVDLDAIEESIRIISGMDDYEFRMTVVKKFHDVEDINRIGGWVVGICGKKPKRFFLQGFKKMEKLLDSSFCNELNTGEWFLDKLKEVAENYFNEVRIRV